MVVIKAEAGQQIHARGEIELVAQILGPGRQRIAAIGAPVDMPANQGIATFCSGATLITSKYCAD
jgi:hypothetical protein